MEERLTDNLIAEPHVLVTKFSIPVVRRPLLPRASLIERLNKDAAYPLALVSAGAGFGKTTLLAAWANQIAHPVAWVALDRLDNDPLRFWSAVLAALRTRFPTLGETAPAPQQSQLIPFLTVLINDLATYGKEIVVVLDDYHMIDEPSIHASLQFLLEHAPACLHLVVSSRVDPPLALSRLRARGQMTELRDADLRVSEQEGAYFLREIMGVRLDVEAERRLAQRTEGWLVGLQLAALTLARHDDADAWVATFSGSQRLILDYFEDEILAQQKPAVRRFLLRASILPRLQASLCQAVTGNPSSQEMLEALERANLLVIPLDEQRQWYRLHDLFREALLARLQATHPELAPSLYERAAQWYEDHDMAPEAIEAALNAGAFERAAELIGRSIDQRSFRNPYHTLCRWLEQLPEETLQSQPLLSFWYALGSMFTSLRRRPASWARIASAIEWAEQGFEAQGQPEHLGEAQELHAELAFFQDDLASMLALARQATPLLSEQSLMSATNRLVRGWEQLLSGQVEAAQQDFLEGRRRAENFGSLTGTVSASLLLAEACVARGELSQAARYCRQTLATADEDPQAFQDQLMTATGDREPFFLTWAYHLLARLAYEWNDLSGAEQALAQAQALGADPAEGVHVLTSGGLIRVRLLRRRGETQEAQRLLDIWEQKAHTPWDLRAIRACQARLQLDMGNLSAVEQWSRARDGRGAHPSGEREPKPPYIQQEDEALLVVRLLLAQEQPTAALQALAPWKAEAEAATRVTTLVEMRILEALAHCTDRALPQAGVALCEALRLAQPERYQRLFLDEGQAMADLLKSSLKDMQEPSLAAYVRGLLDAFEQAQPGRSDAHLQASSSLVDPLTPQEQRVLRLLAEGASNQQIAQRLVVSLATVRKHVSNILSKLGAENRTQAVALARRYGLL